MEFSWDICYSISIERFDELSALILKAAMAVHKEIGPGQLETVYQQCMVHEMRLQSVPIDTMVMVPLVYKGFALDKNYIVDILVEQEIILELKAVESILSVHEAQIISYLKLADKRLGFLINFNVPLIKNGLRRFVNRF